MITPERQITPDFKEEQYTECEDCCGTGTEYLEDEDGNMSIPAPCSRCEGTGELLID